MSSDSLLCHPVWRADQLGKPIPDSPHAVSMALPRWQDVVDYEEKTPAIQEFVKTGYPRFVVHPLVRELGRRVGGDRTCLPFPSPSAARLAAAYVNRASRAPAEAVSREGVWGVITTAEGSVALKDFWQHTGLIVSSRQAEACLAGRRAKPEDDEPRRVLRRHLAGWYDCAEDDVFLTPTGMAAQFRALQAVRRRCPDRPTVQLGFPYVDTLKLQQKLGDGGILLYNLERIEADLKSLLEREPVAACFGEIPGNPLLGSADLRRISPIIRKARVPLVADDVVATPANVDLAPYADLVATSLTKFVVGTAEAMGGAVICNPRSPLHGELKAILREQHEDLLWGEDAAVIEVQARGFVERMRRHNASGLLLAERLRRHPAIARVWYPKWEFSEAYEAVRRPDGGWGALITFLPGDAPSRSPAIYNRLEVCKGPSLGTAFTLACPFTLLAHYTELDWAESCGVSRYLIRISVGLEDPEDLWRRLESALAV
ncbi:MAG TPA: PLP-dependent transferase [Verrucomicrobiota bacterium]|nr:PLP-dependent transferase [Verrucomicrobiota bacterium]HRT56556.1 PLP-dependent transferase [Candidatus Paceibacterota bacterium]